MADFELGPAPVDPLDMSTLGGMPAAPQAPAPRPAAMPAAPKDPSEKRNWLKLAMLLPLAAKQPGGVEGLLMGWQQAQAQKQATQRQGLLDQQAAQREQRIADQQQQQLMLQAENQRAQAEQRRAQFLSQFTAGLQTLEDDEAVRAYVQLHTAQAPAFGVQPAQLEQTAMQVVKPSDLQRKSAEKIVGRLKSQFGDNWMEEGAKFSHVLPDSPADPESGAKVGVSLQEVLRRAGMVPDPNAPVAAPKPDSRSLEVQAADALRRGDTAEYQRLQQVKKDMGTADDRAPDPLLQEIRTLTAANLRNQQAASMTPAQAAMARGFADDFTRDSKDYITRLQAYQTIRQAAANPSAAGDLALIFSFMKMLDPGSTVREGEFANAQNAAGVPDQIRNAYNRTVSGERLNPRQRVDFANQARQQFMQAQTRQRGLHQVYSDRATRARLNPADVVIDYDEVFGVDTSPITAAGAAPTQNPYRGGGRASGAGQ